MKKILVPVDFTDYSENAVRMAANMAATKGMFVKLIHLVEEPSKGISIPFFNKKDKEAEEDYTPELIATSNDYLKELKAKHIPASVECAIESRKVSESVVEDLLTEDADLIVMGRKRPENRDKIFEGSTAEKMVRLSAAPVITVGELYGDPLISEIVFASDFEDEEIEQIILRVLDLAKIFDADLHFLYVEPNREHVTTSVTQRKASERLKRFNLQDYDLNIYVSDSVETGIQQYVLENDCDLLILCTHGRTGIAQVFKESLSENFSAYGTVPVLTYNINKKKIDKARTPIARQLLRERSKKRV